MKQRFPKLFAPCNLTNLQLKNHLIMAPMTTNFATDQGFITDRLLHHYETRAKGGVGLVIVEATCVESPRGKAFDFGLILDNDKYISGFSELTERIHKHNCKIAVQLHHAGAATRTCITHMQPVSASSIAWPGFDPPRALDVFEIKAIEESFAKAACRARKAGIDGIEIHAAHHYLFAQFLSSYFNTRTDEYGGDLENRARFLVETLHMVKESVGSSYPVWCRINGKVFGKRGIFELSEALQLVKIIEKAGSDALHISAFGWGDYAGYNTPVMYDPSCNLVSIAETIKKQVNIPVIAVGKISLECGERLVSKEKVDFIALGRPLLADPDFLNKIRRGKSARPCLWCRVCGDIWLHVKRSPIRCPVNPSLGTISENLIIRSRVSKKVLVIGGGPAGMEAALVASKRGHSVSLFENSSELGGQMLFACLPPCKQPIANFKDYLVREMRSLGVKVELGRQVDAALIEQIDPDLIVLATGAKTAPFQVPGSKNGSIPSAEDVFKGHVRVGKEVTIIGGGATGCELADYLLEKTRRVTVLETTSQLVPTLGSSMRARLLSRLKKGGVRMICNVQILGIRRNGVDILYMDGRRELIRSQTVVSAVGLKPDRALLNSIRVTDKPVYIIGDSVEPRSILEAVAEGFRIGSEI